MEMLAAGLSHGHLLAIEDGRVRLGFRALDGMYRRQAERSLKDAEAAIAKALGRPASLVIESFDEAMSSLAPSLAQEEQERIRARESSADRVSREHPNVLAAMRILGASIESIRYSDEAENDADSGAEEA